MMRTAIYWAPTLSDPLHLAGSSWLGRDAESGAALRQPEVSALDLHALTVDARRYGLHATLKPPFHLSSEFESLVDAVRRLAVTLQPFELPRLQLTSLDGFLALREERRCDALHHLADCCVAELDGFRKPPSTEEMERRRPGRLTPPQREYLMRWGYPYVFDTWRFHITLSRRLSDDEMGVLLPLAQQHFVGALEARLVDAICIFTQAAPDSPFLLTHRIDLGRG